MMTLLLLSLLLLLYPEKIAYDLKSTIYKARKRLKKGKPNVFD